MVDQFEELTRFTKVYKKVRNYDVSIYFSEIDPAKVSLVFVHGWLGDASGMSLVAGDLTGSYNTFLLDLPGHGDSTQFHYDGHSCDLSMELFLVALDKVVEMTSGIPWIVGHSMGGGVVQEYLWRHPDKVRGAVIVDSAANFRNAIPAAIESFLIKELVEVKTAARLLADFFIERAFSHTRDKDTEMIKTKLRQQLLSTTLEGAICPFRHIISMWTREGDVAEFDNPVLIVVGKEDIVTPRSKAHKMAEIYPNSKVVEVDGATHLLPLTHHKKLSEIIKKYLDNPS